MLKRQFDRCRVTRKANRRGSTLLIVLSLMGLLALMGVLFFTFAAQERASAETFSNDAKVMTAPALNADALFDYALEQLILGPDDTKVLSALAGGRHSLIPNMLGRDGVPFNGEGINLRMDNLGNPRIDQDYNYDPVSDSNADHSDFLKINDSFAASGANLFNGLSVDDLPAPDVNYTYPDINHAFLAYRSTLPFLNDDAGLPVPVILPSFHRPALFRVGGVMAGQWYQDPSFRERSFRPNFNHRYVTQAGVNLGWRYARTMAEAQALGLRGPFPFAPADVNRDGSVGDQGVWSLWTWQGGINIPTGTWTRPSTSNGLYYVASMINAGNTTGDTDSSEPTWPTQPGLTVDDGDVRWTCASSLPYEYDMDLDGDGHRETVLLDLDFPPQHRGDGTLVVPMFGYYIIDADGLINLNTSGHVGANPFPSNILTTHFGNDPTFDFSRSNTGLTASEVNPMVALYADPDPDSLDRISNSSFDMHRRFLQTLGASANTNPRSPQELRNLEAFFLLMGSPEFTSGVAASADAIYGVITGRYGEDAQFLLAMRDLLSGTGWTFPAPGAGPGTLSPPTGDEDDNSNFNIPKFPAYGWPVDYRGTGNVHDLTTGNGKRLRLATNQTPGTNAIGPNRWLQFNRHHVYDPANPTNADVRWPVTTFGGVLRQNSANQLENESLEAITDPSDPRITDFLRNDPLAAAATRTAYFEDAQFGPADMAFLHLSPSDRARLAMNSRLAKLAPANFVGSARNWDIRRQFTVLSGDRREVGKWTPSAYWGATSPSNLRAWEADVSGHASNPFRTVVQWLLNEYPSSTDPAQMQRWKLSLHQLLVDGDTHLPIGGAGARFEFRNLTPHPTASFAATAISTTAPPYQNGATGNWTNLAHQEYWARIDRQCLARDVYTLLYVYGSERSGSSAGTDSPLLNPTFHSTAAKREMAQFAVNFVDALDPDDVITRFEYDTDLSNGWNLDDNPYTDTDGGSDREEVWGVERQQLTLSEFIAIHAPINNHPMAPATDHTATEWDDSQDNYFTFIELLNASPLPVNFASNWQIKVWPRGSDPDDSAHQQAARQVILRSAAGTINGGDKYLIASESSDFAPMSGVRDSVFRVDPDNGNSYRDVIPTSGSAGIDLDLLLSTHANRFYILDGENADQSTVSGIINSTNADPASTSDPSANSAIPLVVSLRRRANLQRQAPTINPMGAPVVNAAEDEDNPWIEVDRFRINHTTGNFGVGMVKFKRTKDSNDTDLPNLLAELVSSYSAGPFDPVEARDTQPSVNDMTFTPALRHSLGEWNRAEDSMGTEVANPVSHVTQFHFDRPYQSLAELMEIPTVGNRIELPNGTEIHPVRQAVSYGKLNGNQQATKTTPSKTFTFGGKLSLIPSEDINGNGSLDDGEDFNQNTTLDGIDSNTANRWYRLLNFLELPGGTNRYADLDRKASDLYSTPDNFGWPREMGLVNLNTIRHHTVLGAILDDPLALTVQPPTPSQSNFIESLDATEDDVPDVFDSPDGSANSPRDWWKQFLQSRDTYDGRTVDPVSGLVLPGLGNSRPFRGLDFTARGGLSRDDTVFRRLPGDLAVSDPRLLFELANRTEHAETVLENANDSYARYRLYQKLLNRTTTRSNTFIVYVGVQFHEAAVDANGAVRIGSRLEDTPIHRGFFIIDRSGAVDQVRQLIGSPSTGGFGRDAVTDPHGANGILKTKTPAINVDYFSYRALTSPEGDPANGIDWRALIKYRQLLN